MRTNEIWSSRSQKGCGPATGNEGPAGKNKRNCLLSPNQFLAGAKGMRKDALKATAKGDRLGLGQGSQLATISSRMPEGSLLVQFQRGNLAQKDKKVFCL